MRVAIIQARTSSSRLPNKVLKFIGDKRVLKKVIDRAEAVNLLEPLIDKVVVATSLDSSDDIIEGLCANWMVDCFRGSLDDVLSRYYECAIKFKADEIIRITGDCPLIEPLMIWGLIKEPFKVPYKALDFAGDRIVDGWDCEIVTKEALEDAYINSEEREHVTTHIREKYPDNLTQMHTFDFSKLKLSLDNEEDLKRIQEYSALL